MALRRTPLARKSELKRGTRIAPVNRKRKRERYERDFGDKARWISTLPCLVCGKSPSDPHHWPSRSRGGTSKDLTPLCRAHHDDFHAGPATFMAFYRVNLIDEADRYHAAWLKRGDAA
jgi:hypothetical protein